MWSFGTMIMSIFKRLTAYLSVIVLLLFAACDNDNNSVVLAPELDPGRSSDDIIRNTVKIDYGKPGAPISLTYQVPKSALSGTIISVQLELISATQTGSLQVILNTDTAMSLNGSTQYSFALDGQVKSIPVELYLAEDGLHYLNVITQELDDSSAVLLGRSFAVPIQVGQLRQKMRVNGKMMDDGDEKIIEMIAD